MNGVRIVRDNSASSVVFHIESFSDDLKKEIRKRLSSICHGERNASAKSRIYSYEQTLKVFWSRYKNKSKRTKKGMIGELLSHIIILREFPQFLSATPFFNMEEGSIKKGFDLILFHRFRQNIWITEVKSGEAGQKKSDARNISLLNTAKNDLKTRLNDQGTSIWYNALNGASLALRDGKLKDKINAILSRTTEDIEDANHSSANENVILVSVLYNSLDDRISIDKVATKRNAIATEDIFHRLLVFSIQKATYKRIARFLKEEANGE